MLGWVVYQRWRHISWSRKHRHSRWNFVLSCTQAEIYVISYALSVQAASFDFSHSEVGRRPSILLDPKICGFRWKFTYIPSIISAKVLPVSRPPFWFPVELGANVTHGYVATSRGYFAILKNKRSNVEYCFNNWFAPFVSMTLSLSHFHQEMIHPTFPSGDVIR